MWFTLINASTHLVIDFFTSRIILNMSEKALNRNIVSIEFDISTINIYYPVLILGLDQLLHQSIIILTVFMVMR